MRRKKNSEFEGWPKRLLGAAVIWVLFAAILAAFIGFAGQTLETAIAIASMISVLPALIYLIGGPGTLSGLSGDFGQF